ncbi:multi-sensor hybrid histidine kinase [Candidatus Magnetomorum sp. HK-1]|nr:multi-sensor hybrid histidine kinase [Candidatus Magnetomorum sp. HK-1]
MSQVRDMPIPVIKRISFQLARKGFIAALLMAFILGISQIFWDYYLQQQLNNHKINEILTSAQKPASQALYNLDKAWGKIILAGLIKNDFITEAAIIDTQKSVFISIFNYSQSKKTSRFMTLFISSEFTRYSIELLYSNSLHVGTLQLSVDNHVLLSPLYRRATISFVLSIVLVIIIWGIMFIVFQRIITDPMALIIRSFRSIDPRKIDNAQLNPLEGHENDELGLLVTIVNNFIRANAYHIEERVEVEKKLIMLNEDLEKIVTERTISLSQKIIQHESAEKQLRMYEKIVSATSDMIALVDNNYKYILVNESYVNVFGKNKDELIGKTVEELFGKDMNTELQPRLNRCFKGETIVFETWYNYPQTGKCFMSVQYAPWVQDGTIKHVVVSGRNITRLKRAEEQLEMARAEAEEANQAKSEFLARMSHEIRTPMNAIIGLTHLAMQTNLSDKQYDYLYKITTSSQSLLSIINDILDFSKIEAGKLTIENVTFQLDEVLDKVSNILSIKAHKKGLELIFSIDSDVPNVLIGDPLRLGQVLTNLTNNAIKFTDQGEIIIKIKRQNFSYERMAKLSFSVIDTGIGINESQRGTLFKSFSQADRYITRKYGGTGLGLAICKGLVEIMGGKISLISTPGKGSTFSFTSTFGWNGKQSQNNFNKDVKNIHVLLVDDNKASRIIFNKTLSSFAFKVTEVGSGKEAIQLLKSKDIQPFSLILMDWKMPEMDGIETSRQIKALKNIKQIPSILMVTAYRDDYIIDSAKSAGIKTVLTKPVNPSVLLDSIMTVLGKTKIKPLITEKTKPEKYKEKYHLEGNILLVEDNKINQEVAYELLSLSGFHVEIANNGRCAFEMYEKQPNHYDAILMDIQMPEMDGYKATRLIRRHESEIKTNADSQIPIIAMTAHAMTDEKKRCLSEGMNDYTTKPIDPDNLIQTLCRWIPHLSSLKNNVFNKKEDESLSTQLHALQSSYKGLNTSSGIARVSYQINTYINILKSFVCDFSDSVIKIKKSLEQNLNDESQTLVHNLKGVSGNLGADIVYKDCCMLENMIKVKDFDKIPDHIQQLEINMDETLEAIRKLIQDNPETKEFECISNPDQTKNVIPKDQYQKIQDLISNLDRLLQQHHLDAEQVLKSLKKLLNNTSFIQELCIIEEHMKRFDYSQAHKIFLNFEKSIQKIIIQES